jgi:ubiquinone/menaquinone biosynthesis C-methylase UbiE
MLEAYLSEIPFPEKSRALEIGCGTGAVSRRLAERPDIIAVVGVDPSPVFVATARELAMGLSNISFRIADGRSIELDDASFEVVVVHTTLSHVPEPASLLTEAHRLLVPGGWLAVFDGDYATITVAKGHNDPLQPCIDAARHGFVHDPWLVRRLPRMVEAAGFVVFSTRSHGYVESPEAGYILTLVDRGADLLASSGRISARTAEALKREARERSENREWFGHIAYASVVARKAD